MKENFLLLLGLGLFLGSVGARLFQKMRIPQVVGTIMIGIVLGKTGLDLLDKTALAALEPFNYFALGLIGFMIGSELKKAVFVKHGKQFVYILLFEGITAFVMVSCLVGFFGSHVLGSSKLAWSFGLLLGAIAAATAPAATTDVLREYKTKGPLTRTILGIVALDDGLALILFAGASSLVALFLGMGNQEQGFFTLLHPFIEISGSMFIGVTFGWVLSKITKRYTAEDRILAFSLGTILLALGVSFVFSMDMLIVAMTMGATLTNHSQQKSKKVFQLVEKFSPPIYILFFVLVGAKLDVSHVTKPVLFLAFLYLVGRTVGKMLGANFGAKLAKAPRTVQRYLPLCLFSQAGVAIGLSILASHRFEGDVGNIIVAVITLTTFLVQLIGPTSTKIALTRAKEVGLNISEEDLIQTHKVSDCLKEKHPFLHEGTSVPEILKIFSDEPHLYYAVIDEKQSLRGVIGFENIKDTFLTGEVNPFLLAHDIMEPSHTQISPDVSILEAKEMFARDHVDHLSVVDQNNQTLGILEIRDIDQLIKCQIIDLHQKAESLD